MKLEIGQLKTIRATSRLVEEYFCIPHKKNSPGMAGQLSNILQSLLLRKIGKFLFIEKSSTIKFFVPLTEVNRLRLHGGTTDGASEGGTVANMVPNRCMIGLDRRVLPAEDHEAAKAEIAAVLRRVEASRPGAKLSMREVVWWPGYVIDEQEPIVRYLVRAFEVVMGSSPAIRGKDAGTDASWINLLGGIPVVMFSPGCGPEAMNANENVGIEDMVNATAVVAQLVVDILGIDARRERQS